MYWIMDEGEGIGKNNNPRALARGYYFAVA